ncbi:MAG: carboxylesterase/lipase family protein [Deltaproteobacteria bacterium]|nr:carboxylesterase/lipase family protein [Deltaproteobacteria bacterium]
MAAPRVTTRSGTLEGEALSSGTLVFRGIPYAAPPVGPRRFRLPEPMPRWDGIRSATAFGPSAPQNDSMVLLVRQIVGAQATQQEDCLYLNVWTPAADGKKRPVLVWIHGGAFVLGSGATGLYSGERLARRGDVVVVTINYRLGALGFLNVRGIFDEREIDPNVGLHDQIAALEWVRDNIEAFGGDPGRVTVFGESAGGMSVGTLLGTPRAQGLFSRAILQSGAAHNVSSAGAVRRVTELFLEELGADGKSAAALRGASVGAILDAQRSVAGKLGIILGVLPWQPSIDGSLLTESPYAAIASGRVRPVPTIIGTNRDEWRLFLLGDRHSRSLDDAALRRRFERTLEALLVEADGLLDSAMTSYGATYGRPIDRWCSFQSDRVFHVPASLLAEACARAGSPSYLYRFDWMPRLLGGLTGAFHGLEIPFVFGTLRGGLLRATLGVTTDARSLSNRMQRAWVSFASDGVPRAEKLPEWPAYVPEAPRTMIFGTPSVVKDDLHAAARTFFGAMLGSADFARREEAPRIAG